MNPYTNYYLNQAGSGITGFAGTRYQRGSGFFGKFFSSSILPILKYFGTKALGTSVNVAEDLLEGKKFKESMETRAIETGKNFARDAIDRGRSYMQKGFGKKRKRKSSRKKSKSNRKRRRTRSKLNFLR